MAFVSASVDEVTGRRRRVVVPVDTPSEGGPLEASPAEMHALPCDLVSTTGLWGAAAVPNSIALRPPGRCTPRPRQAYVAAAETRRLPSFLRVSLRHPTSPGPRSAPEAQTFGSAPLVATGAPRCGEASRGLSGAGSPEGTRGTPRRAWVCACQRAFLADSREAGGIRNFSLTSDSGEPRSCFPAFELRRTRYAFGPPKPFLSISPCIYFLSVITSLAAGRVAKTNIISLSATSVRVQSDTPTCPVPMSDS